MKLPHFLRSNSDLMWHHNAAIANIVKTDNLTSSCEADALTMCR